MSKSPAFLANALWQKQPKANAELFALTYGALVGELWRDLETPAAIQDELDRMGHSIGIRCIEEFLAKSDPPSRTGQQTFAETADLLKMAMRMFLGVSVETNMAANENTAGSGEVSSFSVIMQENPLALFVELPEDLQELEYSQMLCGMIRGMLEMLQFDVSCRMAQSQLKGDDVNEIQVDLNQVLKDGAGEDYQEE
jgi:trafficking protein particle complex subunit 3